MITLVTLGALPEKAEPVRADRPRRGRRPAVAVDQAANGADERLDLAVLPPALARSRRPKPVKPARKPPAVAAPAAPAPKATPPTTSPPEPLRQL